MKTVLVLEDEPAVLRLLRYILKEFNLLEASSAEEALQLFANRGRQIALLLADVTLPASSGIQVALFLRAEIPNLPVILTSGYAMIDWSDRDVADLKSLGEDSVTLFQKPFMAQELLITIRQLIELPQSESAGTA